MNHGRHDAVEPSGIDVTITDAGTVLLDFDAEAAPTIRLSAANAKRVGGTLSKAGDTAGDGRRSFND
jgi:hypothetical protein